MSVEEFRLSDTTTAALAVPPTCSVGVKIMTRGTGDGDTGTLNL